MAYDTTRSREMLYGPPGRESLISEEFNNLCVRFRVEARIEPFPNPGDPYKPMRRIYFRSFSDETLFVHQQTRKRTHEGYVFVEKKVTLPAKGECNILISPDDPMPGLGRE